MLAFLPVPFRFLIGFFMVIVNTVISVALLLLLTPFSKKGMVLVAEAWIAVNGFTMRLTQKIRWDVQIDAELSPLKSYLVIANHQSWVDIVVLQKIFNKRIPLARFFLKQELMWVPLLNLAWVALDFPFMKRYSKEELRKHPEKKGKDFETTRKACEKFRGKPITILNFLEGTRLTPAKHARQDSPFRHLLRPKSGGIAFVLQSMGDQFDSILDVTIHYPDAPVTMSDLLSGRVTEVQVRVRRLSIPPEILQGDYQDDANFRQIFHEWVKRIWTEKDQLIANLKNP